MCRNAALFVTAFAPLLFSAQPDAGAPVFVDPSAGAKDARMTGNTPPFEVYISW